MLAFSAEERARLAYLVPMAQRLFAGDVHRYSLWIGQLSDHERALLVRWIAHYGPDWHTAPLPKVDQ
jgi:hypothetical protein